uniref:Kinesin motor domain-containing protein n=1 Tax=Xiphophorus couchianus TaxID=32473 RepID=A0A3B5KZA2_9TELE
MLFSRPSSYSLKFPGEEMAESAVKVCVRVRPVAERQNSLALFARLSFDSCFCVCCACLSGTIFAYGQTSSGKTFTMMGSDRNRGVIPLFPNKEFLLRVSYMEIYNETVTDLLVDSWKRKPLEIRETMNVSGLNGFCSVWEYLQKLCCITDGL